MRSITFGTACAAILMTMTSVVLAVDLQPPPPGSSCDILSREYIASMGMTDKALRAKVQGSVSFDELSKVYLDFQLVPERREGVKALQPRYVALEPMTFGSSIYADQEWAKVYDERVVLMGMQDMANANGAWVVVVPNHDGYYAQVVIQLEKATDSTCIPAYKTSRVLGTREVSADLFK